MPDPEDPTPADDPGSGADLQEQDDDPGQRDDAILLQFGVPAGDFPGRIDAAVQHALAPGHDAGASAWTSLGPRNVGGAVRALVQDPNEVRTFYAGSASGGLWKSVDEGLSWRPMGASHQAFPVCAIAVAPGEGRIVYVASGNPAARSLAGSGLYLSTDGGVTLTKIAGTAGAGGANHYGALQIDPRRAEAAGAGKVTAAAAAVTGTGTSFHTFFAAGDVLRVGLELRVVTAVADDTHLTIDRPFVSPLTADADYFRATPRVWAAGDSGLWRFEPGSGFAAEGSAAAGSLPPGNPASDVVLAEDPAAPTHVILLAGVRLQGLYRGVHDRGTHTTAWTRCPLRRAVGGNPLVTGAMMGRINVALTPAAPFHAYAIFEDIAAEPAGPRNHPSRVYHSADFGVTWTTGGRPFTPAAGAVGFADYTLVIAVDPANPARVIAGGVNLFVSTNSATTWNQISDWTRYAAGDRNQYADHHAVLFDRNRADHPNRVWIANDGGVSSTDAVTTAALYPGWRKRSYGINAAQFYDVTVHPTLPFLTGGGLQDNGTYLSYGGFTWYQVDSGDGGSLAYTSNPRLLYGTSSIGLDRLTVGAAATLPGTGLVATTLPDVAPAGTRMRSQRLPRTGFPAANGVPFIGILEGHPTSDHHLLVGRVGRAFRSVDGNTFTAVGPALAAGEQVTAMSFLPGQPSTVYWFATNQGRIFRAGPVAAPALVTAVPWPGGAAPWVHRIAFAAAGGGNFRVAVCSAGNQGELFVADIPAGAAAAVGWQRVTAGLPPGPFLALAFEPADPTRLFVGTFAGVYGCSDLPAFPIGAAAPAPTWQTFNAGLPIVIAHDLAVSPVTRTLRCATFGRGVFERELNATPPEFKIPAVGLLIRNHLMDDGRPYAPANTLANDPRQGAGVAIDDLHSFDIRVDAPRFQPFEVTRFGEPIDGGEFDETMVHDSPIAGEANVVYVQVQNRGNQPAHNAQVHLFFAAAPGPAAAPDLQAGFRAAFSGNLPAGGWQRAAPAVTVGEIGPGQPAVARFEWTPPLDIGANAALLAITTADPGDKLDLVAMPAANDVVLTLVRNERRAAVRITPVVTDPVYIRDGVDDDGSFGAVAWGGRSPDIAVLAAAPPADVNTNAAFTDLDDPRRGDRVQAGANQVIVRVFNRSATAVAANVDLFRAPLTGLDTPSAWVRLSPAGGVATPVIPARSWRFTAPVAWNVTDAATTFVLVALASPVVAGGPPKPDTGDVHNLETLWRFLRSGTLADKAAMRALRRA